MKGEEGREGEGEGEEEQQEQNHLYYSLSEN